jgi:hypothetical protein
VPARDRKIRRSIDSSPIEQQVRPGNAATLKGERVRISRRLLVVLLGAALTVLAAYLAPKLYQAVTEYRVNGCPTSYILALHQDRNHERLCPR